MVPATPRLAEVIELAVTTLPDRNAGCLNWESTILYLTQLSHLTHRKTEGQPVRESCPEAALWAEPSVSQGSLH